MVTVGYGDIKPVNNFEKIFSIITMLASCGIYAFFINTIGQIVENSKIKNKFIQQNLYIINNYMQQKNIAKPIKIKVREYLDYYWNQVEQDNEQEQTIINQLSDSLKQTLLLEANKMILVDSPIFQSNFSSQIIGKTIGLIKEKKCNPGEYIFKEGDTNDNSIYFIEKGEINILQQKVANQSIRIDSLSSGNCFGQLEFFTGEQRNYSVQTIDFCVLLKIQRDDFLQLIYQNPLDFQRFKHIQDNLIYNSIYNLINVQCQSCLSSNHTIINCQMLHFDTDKRQVIRKFNHLNQKQQIQNFQRKEQKTFNFLTNYKNVQEDAIDYQELEQEYIEMYQNYNLFQQIFEESLQDLQDIQEKQSSIKLPSKNQDVLQVSQSMSILKKQRKKSRQLSNFQKQKEQQGFVRQKIREDSANMYLSQKKIDLPQNQKHKQSIQEVQINSIFQITKDPKSNQDLFNIQIDQQDNSQKNLLNMQMQSNFQIQKVIMQLQNEFRNLKGEIQQFKNINLQNLEKQNEIQEKEKDDSAQIKQKNNVYTRNSLNYSYEQLQLDQQEQIYIKQLINSFTFNLNSESVQNFERYFPYYNIDIIVKCINYNIQKNKKKKGLRMYRTQRSKINSQIFLKSGRQSHVSDQEQKFIKQLSRRSNHQHQQQLIQQNTIGNTEDLNDQQMEKNIEILGQIQNQKKNEQFRVKSKGVSIHFSYKDENTVKQQQEEEEQQSSNQQSLRDIQQSNPEKLNTPAKKCLKNSKNNQQNIFDKFQEMDDYKVIENEEHQDNIQNKSNIYNTTDVNSTIQGLIDQKNYFNPIEQDNN